MCSRFELSQSAGGVGARFGLTIPPPFPNRAEVRPTDLALVLGPDGRSRLLRWGLAVEWDKRPLINARAETLSNRPTFRRLLGARVLVPASAWWEWQGPSKAKMKLRVEGGELFALAGLVDGDSFAIVTCAAAPAIAHVHDRMPVVLPRHAEAAWADPSVPFERVAPLLVPHGSRIEARPDGEAPRQGDLFG